MGLLPTPLPIEVLRFCRSYGLLVALRRLLGDVGWGGVALTGRWLIHAVVNHGVVVPFSLPVLYGRGHGHWWQVHAVVIFCDLGHAIFDHIALSSGRRPRLDIAVVPASS